MLRGMATVSYWADDLEAAKRWYADLLGLEPYFAATGPDHQPAYYEFRLGDYQQELGLIDRRYAPEGAATGPAGALLYWHVDDLTAALEGLMAMGATEHQPPTERGAGFITASVIDPFGNILGIMHNPHYLEVLRRRENGYRCQIVTTRFGNSQAILLARPVAETKSMWSRSCLVLRSFDSRT